MNKESNIKYLEWLDKEIERNNYYELYQDLCAIAGLDPAVEFLKTLYRHAEDIHERVIFNHREVLRKAYHD